MRKKTKDNLKEIDEKLKYICAVVLTDGYFPKPNVLIRNATVSPLKVPVVDIW